jgi:hypothetical protein
MVGDGPSFQSLSRTMGGITPTIVTSIQLRTDDASAARATRSVKETHAAEIHQETEEDAMNSPTFLRALMRAGRCYGITREGQDSGKRLHPI